MRYKIHLDFTDEFENDDSRLKNEGLVENNFLIFKIVDFPNPISSGDKVHIGGYNLGTVEEVRHYLSEEYTNLYVAPEAADTYVFLSKYKQRQSGLEDLIERWIA